MTIKSAERFWPWGPFDLRLVSILITKGRDRRMIWLRLRILVFTGYACLFCLFVLIPFGVMLAMVWLFGWLRNPFQWLILGGVVIWAVWRFPAQVHKFILEHRTFM